MRSAVVGLLLVAAAACSDATTDDGIASAGGGPGGDAVAATPSGEFDPVRWVKCLREHGLTVDDPPIGDAEAKPQIHEELVSVEQYDAATQACQQFNPNFGQPLPPLDPAEVELGRQFAACMREHGVPFDDPGPDGRIRPADPATAAIEPVSGEQFDEALRACNDLVPGVATIPSGGTK